VAPVDDVAVADDAVDVAVGADDGAEAGSVEEEHSASSAGCRGVVGSWEQRIAGQAWSQSQQRFCSGARWMRSKRTQGWE